MWIAFYGARPVTHGRDPQPLSRGRERAYDGEPAGARLVAERLIDAPRQSGFLVIKRITADNNAPHAASARHGRNGYISGRLPRRTRCSARLSLSHSRSAPA